MKTKRYLLPALFLCLLVSAEAIAQQAPNPRPSPVAISALNVDGTHIKVVYGMPHKRDRQIFGGLVPYGEVWRTGANEATEITFTKDVVFGGVDVPAGTYALFSIPNEGEWTIILNKVLGQWGAYRYNAEHDLVRFTVSSHTLDEEWEAFRILLANDEGKISLSMNWERTGVTIPIALK